MIFDRFIVLGDSFSEGMTDEIRDGNYRGWGDRVADVLATKSEDFTYANFAIRGKLVKQVLDDQIPRALPLITGPKTLVSFHAGANDALRPSYNAETLRADYRAAVEKLAATGATIILFTVVEKTGNGGRASELWFERFSTFNAIVHEIGTELNLVVMDSKMDPESASPHILAFDRLHLNERGHYRVAHAVLERLGQPHDAQWRKPIVAPEEKFWLLQKAMTGLWILTFVLPWVLRRLQGKSSGDGRRGKYETPISWPVAR